MYSPSHDFDGRSLIILRHHDNQYSIEARGQMLFDGETLTLNNGHIVEESMWASIQSVVTGTQIKECRGFDFFAVRYESMS